MFECDFCDKTFSTQVALGGHRSGHVRRGEIPKWEKPVKNFDCDLCGKKCENGSVLAGHKRTHRPIEELCTDKARKAWLLRNQAHQCEVCQNTEWCGKPIPLELDHVDGNPENNTRENLRLICPNCHAQTETYKGKNVGRVQNSKRAGVLKKYVGLYR